MPVSGSVLLLYAGAHKISMKYIFPEKMFIEVHLYVVKNARNVTQFVLQPFSIEFQWFVKKFGIEGEFSNAQMIIYLRRH
jgi:hypothetical protein